VENSRLERLTIAGALVMLHIHIIHALALYNLKRLIPLNTKIFLLANSLNYKRIYIQISR
jgi:hypothetical protein